MKKFIYFVLFTLTATAQAQVETILLDSKIFEQQQTIQISLPTSYGHFPKRVYPVMYVLHGQWDMAITTATLGVMEGETPEFIVIGINGKGQQLAPVENDKNISGQLFRRYLSTELVPYITKHYRVAEYGILVGHSNAGRFALEQLLIGNPVFNDYFVFSPSLDDGYLMGLAKKPIINKGHLFLSIANEGEHMQAPFTDITQHLKKQAGLSFSFKKYSEYSHQSSKIIALVNALQTRFSNWQPSYEVKIAGFDSLIQFYKKRTDEFGFDVYPDKDDLIRLVAYFAIEDNAEEVKKLSEFLDLNYPESAASLREIKVYLNEEGYKKAAKLLVL